MARIRELLLKAVVPLQVPLIASYECTGRVFAIETKFGSARIAFPEVRESEAREHRYIGSPSGFDRVGVDRLPGSRGWGDFWGSGKTSTVAFEAVGFSMATPNSSQIEIDEGCLGEGYVYIDTVNEEFLEWIRRFCQWAQIILNQPLDLSDPVPGVLSDPNLLVFSWAEAGEERSWLNSYSTMKGITWVGSGNVASERKASVNAISDIVTLASDRDLVPPTAVALLAGARLAVQRNRFRNAMADLGTAVESVLTDILALPLDHKKTLGQLLKAASKVFQLPFDVKQNLLEPRNAAVHQSVEPNRTTVLRAIEIVDSLVRTRYTRYAYRYDLLAAQRPHRQDLIMFRPPSSP